MLSYPKQKIKKLNECIKDNFPHIFPVEKNMHKTFESVSRLVMLDRYSQKDVEHKTLAIGDLVICVIKDDPKFPARGIGEIVAISGDKASIKLDSEYANICEEQIDGVIQKTISKLDKPLELYFEQIAKRVATDLSIDSESFENAYQEIANLNVIPAGRVLFGAGSNSSVTYFNCFVMPFMHDSRGGISKHREQVMEIMSRGGGVGTNGSTLRPKNALAKGVNGRSSGAVSWLNDLSSLTNLVEQGGSRRGAQMIMLADWHPDIIQFIISKMQNANVLRYLINNSSNEIIVKEAKNKLHFEPLSDSEIIMYKKILEVYDIDKRSFNQDTIEKTVELLTQGGRYSVVNSEFLSGANISVAITKDFMDALEKDGDYDLRFPDVDSYDEETKILYNEKWHEIGDVREWEKLGFAVKTYKTIKASDLWDLINVCATYAAEPGIFFIDNANNMTNAVGYNQKVVCTNPCGEQPLAPYSVCNLAALNLANMVDKEKGVILYDKLKKSVETAINIQDLVIDNTTYFLEENKTQALGERRIGLGVMGLHDLLIWCKVKYGSKKSLKLLDELFKFISLTAYKTSINLAKEKGSFPFLDSLGSKEKLVSSGYIKNLPPEISDDILKYGIRNSHLLTIAPTGSTGTMVGVSTGLEPYFAFKYYRSGRLGKFIEVNAPIIEEFLKHNEKYSQNNLPDYFANANELSPEEHADVQCVIQRWIDSSISKTVNAPKGFTIKNVEDLYIRLYKGGAKGGTVYVDGSRDAQVLSLTKEEKSTQIGMINDFGIEVERTGNKKIDASNNEKPLKSDRQDRNIGVEDGDICPICLEGTVQKLGGCNTCNNCNVQLKCGL